MKKYLNKSSDEKVQFHNASNYRIDTSDDCITLRASQAHKLANPQDCEWVTVTNCNLSSSCNAIRLGVGEGSIHDAVFSNLTISDTNQAFNLVAAYVRGNRGTDISGIRFNNIRVQAKEFARIHICTPQRLFSRILSLMASAEPLLGYLVFGQRLCSVHQYRIQECRYRG